MKDKVIKMTLEEAIKYYNSSNDKGFKQLLENAFGKDFWKSKDITTIVYDLDSLEVYCVRNGISFGLPYSRKTINSFEKYLNACYILAKVAEVYNEGSILDWYNDNIYKYLPYKYLSGRRLVVCAANHWFVLYGPGLLYYKSTKLSEASYNNFKEYWEDYWSVK